MRCSELLRSFVVIAAVAAAPLGAEAGDATRITRWEIHDGRYEAGLLTWFSPSLFPMASHGMLALGDQTYGWRAAAELILLGEVATIGLQERQTDDPDRRGRGRLAVAGIIRCPAAYASIVEGIHEIECDGFDGLCVRDRVIVFMLPYEGEYAIPTWYCPNCRIGVRLPRPGSSEYFDEEGFVDLISTKWGAPLDSLTPGELRLWARADPCGVAEALIQEREFVLPIEGHE